MARDDSDEEYVAPGSPGELSDDKKELSDSDNNQEEEDEDLQDEDNDEDDDDEIVIAKRTRAKSKATTAISDLRGANGYSWEDEYQRSWDVVKDNEGQSLESIIQSMIEARKKKIMKNSSGSFQRGIIRTLIVIVDGSQTMLEKDLRPTRFLMTLTYLVDFIVEFFDQNPISQMGIVLMRNGVATLISEVSSSPQYHLDNIRHVKARQHNKFEPKGDPSLQNSLEMARSLLMYNFGNNSTTNNNGGESSKNSKEILILFGALFTSDPGDIHHTINNLIKDDIKVKIIGLSAQVAICQEIVRRTNKLTSDTSSCYGVIMNEQHYKELLLDCVIPLPITIEESLKQVKQNRGVALIKMGFPSKIQLTTNRTSLDWPQLCACHPTQGSEGSKNNLLINDNPGKSLVDGGGGNGGGGSIGGGSNGNGINPYIGYQCPQCSAKVCHLPTICPICGLMLILSTHLARSYHHLVPLAAYKEVPIAKSYKSKYCYGCLLLFPNGIDDLESIDKLLNRTSSRYRCPKCSNDFCIDCDVFVHETLHNCPGCDSM
ncbi:uncharacterized protein KQ657_004278 [Scheffersomyces spartinae]|uniref:VWFA domain-containing protein n=1 Tax=Scheffersomyces spartinae TaxID=45513 RepID=A0A9P7VB36_9ASCO|nr:uncharacterized protein KQ657_004278 [Scheffersomyces spartinae]KAG7194602.1 hypothetical protein KQ657_004278 [Scheffersomyces spartinae]